MRYSKLATVIATLLVSGGCAETSPSRQPQSAELTCPAELADHVHVLASSVARAIPPDLAADDSFENKTLGRRLLVSVSVDGMARGAKVQSSSLAITTLGGTFRGWAARTTATGAREPVARKQSMDVIPGRLRITPFLDEGTLQPQTGSLDVFIVPGSNPVDEMSVSTSALWNPDRRPQQPEAVQVTLNPLRHFAQYDQVEATLSLHFVTLKSRFDRERSECTVENRLTLVERDELMPRLWDLRKSAQGRSELWLALFDPQTGPFRAIFTSPAEADRVAMWVRQTHSSRLGSYQLGLFRPDYSRDALRTLPSPHSVSDTFRPASAEDLNELVVGRLGEP